jgi:NADH-quinone oxidoreductase subunit M
VIVAPLVALLLALGFFPKPVLDVIDEGVGASLAEVGVSDPPAEVDATTTAEGTAP